VKLTDFGLALEAASPRLTSTGSLAGSPYYMSPEQIDGAGLDARTDVYSLGVVLYEAATGSKPFLGESTFSIMLAHRNSLPVPPIELEPTIGQALNNVILTALAKDPRDRFQTAADFRHALDAARKALNLALSAATSTFSKAEERRAPRGLLHSSVLRWAGVVLAMALGVILGSKFASLLFVRKDAPPVLHAPAPPPSPAPPVALEPKPQVADTQKEPAAEPESAPAVRPKPARRKTVRAEEAAGGPMVIIGHDAAAAPQAHAPAVPETASQPAASPAEPAATAADKAAPPDEAATTPGDPDAKPAAAAPQKQRHRVWRALGRIVRPWKKSSAEKPQAEEAPPK
jgi:serine/threonine-protein kinase